MTLLFMNFVDISDQSQEEALLCASNVFALKFNKAPLGSNPEAR